MFASSNVPHPLLHRRNGNYMIDGSFESDGFRELVVNSKSTIFDVITCMLGYRILKIADYARISESVRKGGGGVRWEVMYTTAPTVV